MENKTSFTSGKYKRNLSNADNKEFLIIDVQSFLNPEEILQNIKSVLSNDEDEGSIGLDILLKLPIKTSSYF